MKKRHLVSVRRYVRKYGHEYPVVTTYCKMEISGSFDYQWTDFLFYVTCKRCIKAYAKV